MRPRLRTLTEMLKWTRIIRSVLKSTMMISFSRREKVTKYSIHLSSPSRSDLCPTTTSSKIISKLFNKMCNSHSLSWRSQQVKTSLMGVKSRATVELNTKRHQRRLSPEIRILPPNAIISFGNLRSNTLHTSWTIRLLLSNRYDIWRSRCRPRHRSVWYQLEARRSSHLSFRSTWTNRAWTKALTIV